MYFIKINKYIVDLIERIGRSGVFLIIGLWNIIIPPYQLFPFLKQLCFIGTRSLLVIIVSGVFVGMVVALQFYDTLLRFGSVALLGSAVGLSLIRELGPVLTALIIIGRAGSAICAEISIMRNEQQIDALECMAIDPFKHLIAPRLLAAMISVPILTAIFITVGIFGGYFVGVILMGVSPGSYLGGMYDSVLLRDILMGSIKSFMFGSIMIWVATVKGFYLHLDKSGAHGSEGVSKVTTDAVVLASISVLFADYIISAIIL
ncbi:MAG: phospholipid/cholesterol/gamma-HCH transport system permease protein [Gammaproteobacteria bacterium]|jgi:phospholipid/cholesterol/gamma-HCH transport system permease protein